MSCDLYFTIRTKDGREVDLFGGGCMSGVYEVLDTVIGNNCGRIAETDPDKDRGWRLTAENLATCVADVNEDLSCAKAELKYIEGVPASSSEVLADLREARDELIERIRNYEAAIMRLKVLEDIVYYNTFDENEVRAYLSV
jgi:hypothetical protein